MIPFCEINEKSEEENNHHQRSTDRQCYVEHVAASRDLAILKRGDPVKITITTMHPKTVAQFQKLHKLKQKYTLLCTIIVIR